MLSLRVGADGFNACISSYQDIWSLEDGDRKEGEASPAKTGCHKGVLSPLSQPSSMPLQAEGHKLACFPVKVVELVVKSIL